MTVDDLLEMLTDVVPSESWCECHGHLRQIDARLKSNGKPIRLMKSRQGYHVSIGDENMLGDFQVPEPVDLNRALKMIVSSI